MARRWTLCVACALVTALGCEGSPTSPAVAAVEVSPASLSIRVGAASQLTATSRDAGGNALTGRSVTWQTDSPTVATVSASGLVTAVGTGTATIAATVERVSGAAAIIVVPVPVASVEVNPAAETLTVGATAWLSATPKDSAGNVLTDRTATWTTDGPTVATVSGSGMVSGMAVGSATVTATVEGKSGTATIAVVGAPIVLRYDGTRWSTALEAVTTTSLSSIWGATASVVYAVGQSNQQGVVLKYDGIAWSKPQPGCVSGIDILGSGATSVWGSSASDVFVACELLVTPPFFGLSLLHYDGQQWNPVYQGGCSFCWSFAGWSSESADVFVVSSSGMILHYDGTSWSSQSSGTTVALFAVWGVGPGGRVFAVGSAGTIRYFDRSTWAAQSSGTTQALYAVWGTSASDVFAVGGAGTVLHYDGTAWTPQSSGSTQTLYGVWGSAGNDVFAVGDAGTIAHYDGTRWTAQSVVASMNLRGVWGSSPVNVFAVGAPR